MDEVKKGKHTPPPPRKTMANTIILKINIVERNKKG
jgi:hypothetical protein